MGTRGISLDINCPNIILYTDIEYFTARRHFYCIITSNASVRWADTETVLVQLASAKCGCVWQVNSRCSVDSGFSPCNTVALHINWFSSSLQKLLEIFFLTLISANVNCPLCLLHNNHNFNPSKLAAKLQNLTFWYTMREQTQLT